MGVLLLCLALVQDAALIDRLESDDPSVREKAYEALADRGEDAAPALKKALKHASPEVRARAADLLGRLPSFQWLHLRSDPRFTKAEKVWNAIIDCAIQKKAVPAGIWKDLGDPVIHLQQTGKVEIAPHPIEWIVKQLAEEGAKDLRYLAQKYGVEGDPNDYLVASQLTAMRALPVDLMPRIAALRPDFRTLEEVYGTIRILHDDGLITWTNALAPRDWDTVLRFLVELRRRPGASAAKPVKFRTAVCLARTGPWINGLAGGLGRAFANPGKKYDRAICKTLRKERPRRITEWTPLEEAYDTLLEMEIEISRCWFWRERLRPAAPAIPPMPKEQTHSAKAVTALLEKKGLDKDALAVVATILSEFPSKPVDPELLPVEAEILGALGRKVAAAARKAR